MFTFQSVDRDFKNPLYALYRVRQIARDTVENPPYSFSDEEWIEALEDNMVSGTYQVFLTVADALSNNPERLIRLTEGTGTYEVAAAEKVRATLLDSQKRLNLKMGLPTNMTGSRLQVSAIKVTW